MDHALDLDANPIDESRSLATATQQNVFDSPDDYEIYNPRYPRANAGVLVSVTDNGPIQRTLVPKADNDNTISWPLGRMIRTTFEGDTCTALLAAAMTYRRVYEAAHTNAELRGVDLEKGYRLAQRTWINPKTGEVEYKGAIKVASGDHSTPGTRKVASGKKVPIRTWNGDAALIERIDACRLLSTLRLALGPIRQPFEDAVVFDMTALAIGKREGFSGKPAEAVAKAYIIRGLYVASDILRQVEAGNGAL